MIRIPINTAPANYEAVIEHGVLSRAGSILHQVLRGNPQLFVITVPPVRRRWGKILQRSLGDSGFSTKIIEMPNGERFKRLSTVEALAESLLKYGADRKAVIV